MKKDFVYFFKHNNINAIKIGKASGESVLDRFNTFRTYAPFGAEIVGFFETDNGHRDEKEIHQIFKSHRLQGEFFDISIDVVKNIIFEKNKDYQKSLTIFNEWIANEENNSEKLINLLNSIKSADFDIDGNSSILVYNYIKNMNYELNKWHGFAETYNEFLKNIGHEVCSKIAFKKNLIFYCNKNGLSFYSRRVSKDRNKTYFCFKA